jgi:uncharacterized delta-60 repeat protein
VKQLSLAVAAVLLCANSAHLRAQAVCTAGQLDLNFGAAGTGYVQTSPVLMDAANGLSGEGEVVDSSNASFSVSTAAIDTAGNPNVDIIKIKAGGARDVSFGGFGAVVPQPPVAAIFASATITADPSGNLVLGIISGDLASIVLYRYTAAGVLDTTFGTSGVVTIPVSAVNGPWAIQAGADGSIFIAAGLMGNPQSSSNWQPVIVKVTAAGALDTSFGVGGFSYFYQGAFGPGGKATDLSIQPDGRVLVGGRVGDNVTYNQFFVARLLANGMLDTSFGTNSGLTVVGFGNTLADGRKMAVQRDGKIVLVGGAASDNSPSAIDGTGVIRLLANGQLDASFNGTGSLQLFGYHGYVVALQNNNKILIGATQFNAQQTATSTLVVRLTVPGQPDPAFGSAQNGIVVLNIPGAVSSGPSHVTYDAGGGILVRAYGNDLTGTIFTDYLVRMASGSGSGCH